MRVTSFGTGGAPRWNSHRGVCRSGILCLRTNLWASRAAASPMITAPNPCSVSTAATESTVTLSPQPASSVPMIWAMSSVAAIFAVYATRTLSAIAAWLPVVRLSGSCGSPGVAGLSVQRQVQKRVLDELRHRRVDPVLPLRHGLRVQPEAHRLDQRLDHRRCLRPDDVGAEQLPGGRIRD